MRTINIIQLHKNFGDLEGTMEVQDFLDQFPWKDHHAVCCVNSEHVNTPEAFLKKVNSVPTEQEVEVWLMPALAGGC
jgi:hypothetical protein